MHCPFNDVSLIGRMDVMLLFQESASLRMCYIPQMRYKSGKGRMGSEFGPRALSLEMYVVILTIQSAMVSP
jgi:hypothetical protein